MKAPSSTVSSRSPSPEPTTHKRRAWSKKYWTLINAWWIWESFGWLLSTACLVAIVGILAYYDGRPLRDWAHSISLNSTLAILSTVSKSALMVPVSAGISQLKWTRLRRGRRLLDLQEFDEASRGPLGSVWLIWRGGMLASIGTLIIITAFAFEPFIQQVVSYPSQQVDGGLVSSIPRSQNYTAYIQQYADPPTVTPDMRKAIHLGLYSNGIPVTPSCSTANCTWNPFESVAICGTCNDVTDEIRTFSPTPKRPVWGFTEGCIMSLPGGLGLVSSPQTQFFEPVFNLSVTNFEEEGATIVNFTSIYYDGDEFADCSTQHGGARATECNIYWCVNTYHSKVSNNVLNETIIASRPMKLHPTTDLIYSTYSLEVNGTTYSVGSEVQPAIQSSLGSAAFISGNATLGIHDAMFYSSDMIEFWYDAATIPTTSGQTSHRYNKNGIARVIDKLTQTMTTTVRSTSQGSGPAVQGIAWEQLTFIHVRWAWLALPFALDLLGIVFLACVVVQTIRTRTEVWKSSQMVTIFRGLSLRDLMDFDAPDDVVEMDEIARKVKVKLQTSAALPEGKRLVKVD